MSDRSAVSSSEGYGPVVGAYLEDLVAGARTVLGRNMFGFYLTGSLALDNYLPGRSDIDVAIVVENELSTDEKSESVRELRHNSLPCPARGLELVVYQADTIRSASLEPAFELELNDGPAMPFRVNTSPLDRDPADGLFWYTLDRDIVAQRGVALIGPPAAEVFGALSAADLRTAVTAALNWHAHSSIGSAEFENAEFENAVLNACRSLVRVETGRWHGKTEAGRQALELDLPDEQASAVRRAVRRRKGANDLADTNTEDTDATADATGFVGYIRNRIASQIE